MSALSAFLHKTFGVPEAHLEDTAVLAAIEKATSGELDTLASKLNLDEAKALSVGAEIVKEAADRRIAALEVNP